MKHALLNGVLIVDDIICRIRVGRKGSRRRREKQTQGGKKEEKTGEKEERKNAS